MAKANKYRARKTEVGGIVFDSRAEARRYGELVLLQKMGEISDLELQPRFDCIVNGKKICAYIADFSYLASEGEAYVVEDVKSPITAKHPVYRLKKKLVEALFGIEIKEITK